MGRMLVEAIQNSADCTLTAALDLPHSPAIGTDAAAFLGQTSGVLIESDLKSALSKADFLIDFTRPEGTMAHLAVCAALGVKVVIGTTGFTEAQKEQIAAYAQRTAIMLAPNMSVGVNVTLKLLEMAAKALSTGYDIEIVEAHHKHKVDAPSGTAIKMGEVIAQAQGTKLEDRAVYERFGHTGERKENTIGFATVRAGDIVGEHTAMFADIGERLEITHKASSRMTFANGAVRSALWLSGKESGLFDMRDVLDLNSL